MPGEHPKKKRKTQQLHLQKRQGRRSYKEDVEIAQLEQRIKDGAPPRGSNPLAVAERQDNGASTSYVGVRTFDELPLSQYTQDGLKRAKYFTLTAIQRAALPHALCGRDILGAAKTGSGKTLAFLIPVVEALYRQKWTKLDGLGALILTPTRELAVQIFEQLQKVGHFHDLSAGLLIGGKNVAEEAARVGGMSILVCTPGRLLQHMDETPGFDTTVLQILVLDEADRILDMGFAATLDAIVANLPRERQTMLFSATQTKSVRDLARLSLSDPEYLAVHAEATTPTPLKLQQAYMVVPLGQKMDVLWSFIRTHLKAKTIIFLSTCKQVRFVFEAFRKLRPGVPLRCLHGGLKQARRTAVFYEFCNEKAMVLIATDIAARGLDFPTVDWVVQADCPEDAATYIHRVGRTARYLAAGRALLLLLPSERDGMLRRLGEAKVPLTAIKPNPAKQQTVTPSLQALLSKDQELKDFAQKALVAYLRSVFLQPAKDVFDVAALPVEDFAAGLGLASVPRLRFLRKVRGKQEVVEMGGRAALEEGDPAGEDDDSEERHEEPGTGAEAKDGEEEGQRPARRKTPAAADARGSATPAVTGRKRSLEGAAGEPGPGSGPGAGAGAGGVMARKTAAGGRQEAGGKDDGSRGGGSGGGDGDDGDDDDFLVVKKRDVFADGPGEREELDGAADGLDGAEASKKKKKKRKIRLGGVSGNRMVFDEEGNALDPLAQLAAEQLGAPTASEPGAAAAEQAGDSGREGVYVVSERPEERFRLAADLMRRRDREDRARLKQLKKELKLERKDRKRAAELEADDGGGAPVAVLGRPAGHIDGGGDDGGYGDSGSGSDVSGEYQHSDGSDDDDDGKAGGQQLGGRGAGGTKRPAARAEVAHMGMATRREEAGRATGRAKDEGTGTRAGVGGATAMSLAEQEALALKLLGAR